MVASPIQIYVSDADGTFPSMPTAAGIWADNKDLKEVEFPSKNARAVRIVAITEAGGRGDWASGSELLILGRDPNSPAPAPAPSLDPPLPRVGWTTTASSEETVGEDGAAENLLDGNDRTIWHTKWAGGADPLPHTLTILMGGQVNAVSGITYLPRQDGPDNGNIGRFEVRCCLDILLFFVCPNRQYFLFRCDIL